MTEIVVWGSVPVAMHVDTETELVTQVVVIDEELRYPTDINTPVDGDGEGLAVAYNFYVPVAPEDKDAAARALEIAKGDAKEPWPAWEFGY